MIIGLCGTSIPGRAEVATNLISRGFAYYSPLLLIEEEAKKQGLTRQESKRKIAEAFIRKDGKSVWVKRILAQISEENAVIDSITSPEELAALRERQDFVLVGVYSPFEIKFERAAAREIFAHEQGEKRKKAIEAISELSMLMKELDFSIVYPTHVFGINAKIEEIIKKGQKK
ncbi:MAG: hypothetical protein ABIJ21_08145 [Nanoarchaeota archaeon]